MAKKRKKQIARKQRKQSLTGLDFESLMDLRNQVDEAFTGYRSTLERQLEALGTSVASFGGKVARMRGSMLKGSKVPRSIVVPMERLGLVGVQNHAGLLRRSRKVRSLKIF